MTELRFPARAALAVAACVALATAALCGAPEAAFAWVPDTPADLGTVAAAQPLAPDADVAHDAQTDEGKSVQHASGTLVVCIDPGHGGAETGASHYGLKEKELNLKISLALRDELNTYAGVRVIMTRSDDSTVGLDARPAYAAARGADLFVSIHCNAVGNTNGFEVWVPNNSTYQAAKRNKARSLGYKILEELAELGRTNRGVKTKSSSSGAVYSDGTPVDYYAVIRGARLRGMVGLLVEHCFVDQPGDAAVLADDNNLMRMGIDDATAIAREYGLKKRTTTSLSGVFRRCAGANALGTMMQASATGFADNSCTTAVLATAGGYWDALSASALAGACKCPVLLTNTNQLSAEAASELARIGASNVYIVGGPAAVSQAVENQLAASGYAVRRLAGSNAVGTALAVYREGAGADGQPGVTRARVQAAAYTRAAQSASSQWGSTCIVATAGGYWDALAASPYAYAKHAPIFLAGTRDAGGAMMLDAQTLAAIAQSSFERVVVCGGTAAVSAKVEAQLATVGYSASKVKRLAGPTAVETSGKIASFCLDEGMVATGMGIATAGGYWDALTGAALCGKRNAPLVLVSKSNISTIAGFVSAHRKHIQYGYIFGGTAAVSGPIEKVANKAVSG